MTARPGSLPLDTGWRSRVRRTPGGAMVLKVAVFLAGAVFVALGIVLAALPGPLTIPPVLLGVYIWSTEFAWAEKLLHRARLSAETAWQQAKRRPITSSVVTVGGLIAAGVVIWAVNRYGLVERALETVGL